MTRRGKNSSPPGQGTLFARLQEIERAARMAGDPAPGSLDCEAEIKAALTADLRHARDESGRLLSRAEVAARMTDLVGTEITLTTINNMTATSHPHRFPLSWLPAFATATCQRRAIEVIGRRTGMHVIPGPDAMRAELDRISDQVRELTATLKRKRAVLAELEAGE